MCFSATASFSAGIVLTVIGVAAIKKTKQRSQILFASVPLVFALQQISEGFLWITLPNPAYDQAQRILTLVFLFFAQIVWPFLVPLAILLLEKRSERRMIQKALVGSGILLAVYFAYCLLTFHVEARIIGHHISYVQDYPLSLKSTCIVLYAIATILPPIFSHIKRMWMLGLTILVSYIISEIFYQNYILSVWCFFASIISVSVYAIMREVESKDKRFVTFANKPV